MREMNAPAAMPIELLIVERLIGEKASAVETPALTYSGLVA